MGLSNFAIHRLNVGAGELAITPMPGRTRLYQTDLKTLIAWGPALVITMTEKFELDRQGAGTFGTDLLQAGIDWRHLPTPDFGVPTGQEWPQIQRYALEILAQKQRVLVHCFGGCGRSGMVCLRLMIGAGEEPHAALTRLRGVRPCAVETAQQMVWARTGAAS